MWLLIVALNSIILSLLFVYGVNILYFSWWAWRNPVESISLEISGPAPFITIQLPIYNEYYVAPRVIEAVCRLDWPRDRLEIQVLDDSTDDTTRLIAQLVKKYRDEGIYIHHLHRTHRTGYKAGALADGLIRAQGEFIGIFDADFVPPSDFLQKTIPYFSDQQAGFVQTRWGHLNAEYSLLTRLQSLAIDAHFAVEQVVRYGAGYLFNFNGTAGVWRREAIDAAGGWRASTLTEDLDLSYRAQFAGWKGIYARDIVTPGELPVTLNAFRRQQVRWARGSMQCARLLIPTLLSSPLPRRVKIQGVLHLTGYGIQVLMMLVVLLYPWLVITMNQHTIARLLVGLTGLFTVTFLAPTVYLSIGQHQLGKSWLKQLPGVLLLNMLGAGMMYQSAFAVLQAFVGRTRPDFERTPKFGITEIHQHWQGKGYRQRLSPLLIFEGLMIAYNLNTMRLAIAGQHRSIAFYAGLFVMGGVFMIGLSAWQEIQQARAIKINQPRNTQPNEEREIFYPANPDRFMGVSRVKVE